jgi:hypothetical protein
MKLIELEDQFYDLQMKKIRGLLNAKGCNPIQGCVVRMRFELPEKK